MKLKNVQVQYFRNILDSTEVEIQPNVTCLVGKNESGKTAFLEALHRLRPAQGSPKISIGRQYPAWLEKRHRQEGKELEKVKFVSAEFDLEQSDIDALTEAYGKGAVTSESITVSREYGGKVWYSFDTDEKVATDAIVASLDLPSSLSPDVDTYEALKIFAEEHKSTEDADEDAMVGAQAILDAIAERLGEKESFRKAVTQTLSELCPRFFYFDEYSTLPGIVKIRDILEKDEKDLDEDELTARSLLEMAGAEDDYLLNPDYETRKRELGNVANAITQDVLEYWTTNQELRTEIDLTKETVNTPQGQTAVLDELHIRMYDNRHWLSLPFEERSTGFQWFFSFLAAFSKYQYSDEPIIILLDEPGLGLHARAQRDFLKYMDEKLSGPRQVIYSTHSPFMVQPDKLERARVVEDKGIDDGSIVSKEVLTTDADTLFPLQGALGYDIAQHLLIAQNNIIIEGPSDLLYLTVFSEHMGDEGREELNDKWSLVPVGGADLIPTFVALLGIHLDVSVLVDAKKSGHPKLDKLAAEGYLKATRIVTVGEVIGSKAADIEDLFTPGDYLKLYNKAFGKSLKVSDLSGSDPIVRQIARAEGIDRFNHNKPADVLLRDRNLISSMSSTTVDNFESLINRLNQTFPK